MLLQHALDPDIDRERAQPFVGEEHHAIRDLRADAGQLAERARKRFIGELAPLLEIGLATRDQPRRREQIFRAITERAFPQILLGQLRDSSCGDGNA